LNRAELEAKARREGEGETARQSMGEEAPKQARACARAGYITGEGETAKKKFHVNGAETGVSPVVACQAKKILCIRDINYGVYILSYILILDLIFYYSYFKIHLCSSYQPQEV
jgi:hypothetical protein